MCVLCAIGACRLARDGAGVGITKAYAARTPFHWVGRLRHRMLDTITASGQEQA